MYPNTLCLHTPFIEHLPPWGSPEHRSLSAVSTPHQYFNQVSSSGCAGRSCWGTAHTWSQPSAQQHKEHSLRPDLDLHFPSQLKFFPNSVPQLLTQHNHRHIAECKADGFLNFPWALCSFPLMNTFRVLGQNPSVPRQELATCMINISTTELSSLAHWRMPVFVPLTCHMYGAFSFLLLIFIQVYEDYFWIIHHTVSD